MDELLYETRDGIGFVTLNRPQARNALTFPMYEKLRQIALSAGDDRTLRAIVITGAGEKASPPAPTSPSSPNSARRRMRWPMRNASTAC
ncbi:enoyl-CoA hydratase/isomerase family protein [Dankookia sp. P2]|uniref:enoyl-CoA hydratase/isomerase family protein n=1 Tax=Dankookia sp. P2 TaxID=3423955 RepID=UPI003D6782CA